MSARHRTPRNLVFVLHKITRVVDLLCALRATLTSDLTGRALSRAVATGTGELAVGATGAPISLAPSGLRFAQLPCLLPRK